MLAATARRVAVIAVLVVTAAPSDGLSSLQAQTGPARPMSFLDMQQMRQVGSPTPS